VALHTLVGAVQAAFGGAPAAAGALGAGSAEAARGLTEGLSPELQQWASVVIGGAAGAMAGGTAGSAALAGAQAGLTGEQFNRQLHPSEQKWLLDQARRFAAEQQIPEREAIERLTQQALREVDLLWRAQLTDGDDAAAKQFLSRTQETFTNNLGEQQRLFTTSGHQLLRPEMFADVADPAFYRSFAQSGIGRTLNEGLLKELKDAGIDITRSAAEFARAATENPYAVGAAVLKGLVEGVSGLPSAIFNGFRESGQALGEGAAVALDPELTAKLEAIYGSDVSAHQRTLLTAQAAVAALEAMGIGKAVGVARSAAVAGMSEGLDAALDGIARKALLQSGGQHDRGGNPLLDLSKLSNEQKGVMGDLFGQHTVRQIVPDGQKIARIPAPGETGIDDVFKVNRRDVDYVVIEYKFVGDPKNPNRVAGTGSDRLNKTKDGLQGSETWILGGSRLQRSVGLDRAIEIQNAVRTGRTETWVVTVRPDGSSAIEVLDGVGKPKDIDTSKVLRRDTDIAGARQ
jgi:filamentous hemagglutinin